MSRLVLAGDVAFVERGELFGRGDYTRVPKTGGGPTPVAGSDDFDWARTSVDGRDVYAICHKAFGGHARLCVIRNGGSSVERLFEVKVSNRSMDGVRALAIDATHAWIVFSFERKQGSTSTRYCWTHRYALATGEREEGAGVVCEPCRALLVDEQNLYCPRDTGGFHSRFTVWRAPKDVDPKYVPILTLPNASLFAQDSTFIYLAGAGAPLLRVRKDAPAIEDRRSDGGIHGAGEVLAAGPRDSLRDKFAVDEDAVYYFDRDLIVRRATR